ncbi:MAG TPA: efflux RND transporter periplasmic adaptor subunit [Terriglobales bacterium]|nr:efflux RND transporter periplasmic adaptor subunit [Terriglobales bacterium]
MLVVALLLAGACSGDKKEDAQAVPVQIVTAENTVLEQRISADAVLFPVAQSALVPKVTSPVKKFLVNRGSHVRAGQLLAVLENSDLAAAAQENKGAYDQAEAVYTTTTAADLPQELQKAQLDAQVAKEALDAQEKVYNSRKDLFQQGALPRKELDQGRVDLTTARNQYTIAQKHLEALNAIGKEQALKSARGQLESAEGKYKGATTQLNYSEIRSPISGVVTERLLFPGEMAAAGTPLMTVMDISQVIARVHIPEASAAQLKVGDKAEIELPGTDKTVPARVTLVSPALDPNSTTVEVWIRAKNPSGQMKPGSSVQVSMLTRSLTDALSIPATALLLEEEGKPFVMVVTPDGHAQKRNVKIGIRTDDRVQIVEGLHAGERIVGSGAYGLPENSKIVAAQSTPEAKDEKE